YGPKGIKEAITLLLKLGDSWTNYPLIFHELTSTEPEKIYEDDKVFITTIPLEHRVYTNGFLIREQLGERKLNVKTVAKYKIDKCYFQNIKNGKDVVLENNTVIPNALLTFDPPTPKSYAFCSDTAFSTKIIPWIRNVDVLYHEATFLETEKRLAPKTKHATAKEAATIAREANVGMLILGHFSTRYQSLDLFKEEAKTIFPNVELADDGKEFDL
ncbi:MAG TPA: ribonuclease Z, partial [Arenibacter sp.]|nr:ribonuclease Z [Arenibacter sp.]